MSLVSNAEKFTAVIVGGGAAATGQLMHIPGGKGIHTATAPRDSIFNEWDEESD